MREEIQEVSASLAAEISADAAVAALLILGAFHYHDLIRDAPQKFRFLSLCGRD